MTTIRLQSFKHNDVDSIIEKEMRTKKKKTEQNNSEHMQIEQSALHLQFSLILSFNKLFCSIVTDISVKFSIFKNAISAKLHIFSAYF